MTLAQKQALFAAVLVFVVAVAKVFGLLPV